MPSLLVAHEAARYKPAFPLPRAAPQSRPARSTRPADAAGYIGVARAPRSGRPAKSWLIAGIAAVALTFGGVQSAPAGTSGNRPGTASAIAPATAPPSGPAATAPSADVRTLLDWLAQTGDHEGHAFAVIDKRQARLWLYDAARKSLGSAAVLLGAARGDVSVPGIGERALSDIKPQERTTPAGRFMLEPGANAAGEDIFWVDYDAAVSMHRVRATNPAERRLQRLATPSPDDNRISYGCINVPAAFYDRQLRPLFARGGGVVYLLPETLPVRSLFTPPRNAALQR